MPVDTTDACHDLVETTESDTFSVRTRTNLQGVPVPLQIQETEFVACVSVDVAENF